MVVAKSRRFLTEKRILQNTDPNKYGTLISNKILELNIIDNNIIYNSTKI